MVIESRRVGGAPMGKDSLRRGSELRFGGLCNDFGEPQSAETVQPGKCPARQSERLGFPTGGGERRPPRVGFGP